MDFAASGLIQDGTGEQQQHWEPVGPRAPAEAPLSFEDATSTLTLPLVATPHGGLTLAVQYRRVLPNLQESLAAQAAYPSSGLGSAPGTAEAGGGFEVVAAPVSLSASPNRRSGLGALLQSGGAQRYVGTDVEYRPSTGAILFPAGESAPSSSRGMHGANIDVPGDLLGSQPMRIPGSNQSRAGCSQTGPYSKSEGFTGGLASRDPSARGGIHQWADSEFLGFPGAHGTPPFMPSEVEVGSNAPVGVPIRCSPPFARAAQPTSLLSSSPLASMGISPATQRRHFHLGRDASSLQSLPESPFTRHATSSDQVTGGFMGPESLPSDDGQGILSSMHQALGGYGAESIGPSDHQASDERAYGGDDELPFACGDSDNVLGLFISDPLDAAPGLTLEASSFLDVIESAPELSLLAPALPGRDIPMSIEDELREAMEFGRLLREGH